MSEPISTLPTPPSTSNPANFDASADAFLAALTTFQEELNAFAASLNNLSTTSESDTELTISETEQTLTVETGKSYAAGQSVKIAVTADGSKWMIGDVQSYNSATGELVVDVQAVQSTGTFSAWTVTLSFNGQISDGQLPDDLAKKDEAQSFTERQTFKTVRSTVYNLTGLALDASNGDIQYKVLSSAPTFTDSLSSGDAITLRLENADTYTPTWPTLTWIGSEPTYTSNDQFVLWKEGSTLFAAYAGGAS
jgi:hypothetical protein